MFFIFFKDFDISYKTKIFKLQSNIVDNIANLFWFRHCITACLANQYDVGLHVVLELTLGWHIRVKFRRLAGSAFYV